MPRPRKAIDYDDEIMKVEAQLIRCDKTKAELLERRQELLNAKRETEVGTLYDALQQKGISVKEIIELIQQTSQQEAG